MSRPVGTRVLITDAHASAAVAATRSLGRRGLTVVAAWHDRAFPLAATSRFCSGILRLPDPMSDPDAYAEGILRSARRGDVDAVIPVSDAARAACTPVRRDLDRMAVYCAAPESALAEAADKWVILERARAAGIGVPPACLVDDETGARAALTSLAPPLVFRSRTSLVRVNRRLAKPATAVRFDLAGAAAELAARVARGESTIVSQYRTGTGRGVYLFMAAGRAQAWFGHVRVRETNPQGSPACASAPLMPAPEELHRCVALASGLGLTGALMIEFRRGTDSEPEWLVEINPRLWGSISLAVHSGLDFPWWQFRYFATGDVPSMPDPRPDVVGCRYLTAELGRLINVMKGPPPGWRAPYPTRHDAWTEFVKAFAPGWRYYHQSVADPLPGLFEPLTFLHGRIRRATR